MNDNKVVIEWWVQTLPDGRKDETIWPYIDLECSDWGRPIRIWERCEEHKKLTPILSLMQGAQGEDRYEWCRDYTLTKEEVFSLLGWDGLPEFGPEHTNISIGGDHVHNIGVVWQRDDRDRMGTVFYPGESDG